MAKKELSETRETLTAERRLLEKDPLKATNEQQLDRKELDAERIKFDENAAATRKELFAARDALASRQRQQKGQKASARKEQPVARKALEAEGAKFTEDTASARKEQRLARRALDAKRSKFRRCSGRSEPTVRRARGERAKVAADMAALHEELSMAREARAAGQRRLAEREGVSSKRTAARLPSARRRTRHTRREHGVGAAGAAAGSQCALRQAQQIP